MAGTSDQLILTTTSPRPPTTALWAPDFDAFLCDAHALGGAHITLIYEPNDSGETAIKVIGAPHVDERRTRIRQESRKSGRGESGG